MFFNSDGASQLSVSSTGAGNEVINKYWLVSQGVVALKVSYYHQSCRLLKCHVICDATVVSCMYMQRYSYNILL